MKHIIFIMLIICTLVFSGCTSQEQPQVKETKYDPAVTANVYIDRLDNGQFSVFIKNTGSFTGAYEFSVGFKTESEILEPAQIITPVIAPQQDYTEVIYPPPGKISGAGVSEVYQDNKLVTTTVILGKWFA